MKRCPGSNGHIRTDSNARLQSDGVLDDRLGTDGHMRTYVDIRPDAGGLVDDRRRVDTRRAGFLIRLREGFQYAEHGDLRIVDDDDRPIGGIMAEDLDATGDQSCTGIRILPARRPLLGMYERQIVRCGGIEGVESVDDQIATALEGLAEKGGDVRNR